MKVSARCFAQAVVPWMLVFLAIAAAGGLAVAQEATPDAASVEALTEEQRVGRLLADGDRMIDDRDYENGLIQYKSAYELIVSDIRGLEFKEPVRPRLMSRSQLSQYLVREFENEFTPQEIELLEGTLKVLDLAPADLDVTQTMIQLFSEEVAGFYNPRSKEMFLIIEDPNKNRLGFLAALVGAGPKGFNKEDQKSTLSHEMAHALADQHYNLEAMDKRAKDNDDSRLAISALVEGEAMLVMMGEAFAGESPGADWTPDRLDTMFSVLDWTVPFAGGRAMRRAPSFFRRSLVFPYHKGSVFAASLAASGDWKSINQAFADPPTSTEQILHPEKYTGQRDLPSVVILHQVEQHGPEGWRYVGQNTLGEFQIQIVLEPLRASEAAAAGWDGDRYAVWRQADGRLAMVWETLWDSEEDAKEFAEATQERLTHMIRKRTTEPQTVEPPTWSSESSSDEPTPWRQVSLVDDANAYYRVRTLGDRVSVAYGMSRQEWEAMERKLDVRLERR